MRTAIYLMTPPHRHARLERSRTKRQKSSETPLPPISAQQLSFASGGNRRRPQGRKGRRQARLQSLHAGAAHPPGSASHTLTATQSRDWRENRPPARKTAASARMKRTWASRLHTQKGPRPVSTRVLCCPPSHLRTRRAGHALPPYCTHKSLSV